MVGPLCACIVLALCVTVMGDFSPGVEADATALLALKSNLTGTVDLSSWAAGSDPCQWAGVACSDSRVTRVYVAQKKEGIVTKGNEGAVYFRCRGSHRPICLLNSHQILAKLWSGRPAPFVFKFAVPCHTQLEW